MLQYISENLATIIVGLAIAAAVAAVISRLIKNKKRGISSCGCGCQSCPMGSSCAKK